MKLFFKKYWSYLVITFFAIFIVTISNFLLQITAQNTVYPDSESYFESAENLYKYQRGHNIRPVILALIHGFPFIFKTSNWSIYTIFTYIINFTFFIGIFFVFFKILTQFLNNKLALWFTFFSMLFIGFFVSVFHMTSEIIATFFIISGFYYFIKYYQNKQFLYLAIALSIFIISMLIKPGMKWIAVVFILFYAKEIIKNRKSKAMRFLYFGFFLIFIQCAGLKYQFGNFTISYIDSVTYYTYVGSKAVDLKNEKQFNHHTDSRANYFHSLPYTKMNEVAKNDLVHQLTTNKTNLLKAYLLNLYENATTGSYIIDDVTNVKHTKNFNVFKSFFYGVSKWQNIIFTLLGFALSIYCFFKYYKLQTVYSLVSFYILYTFFISGISCSEGDRFHVITFPFVLLLLAKVMYEKKVLYNK